MFRVTTRPASREGPRVHRNDSVTLSQHEGSSGTLIKISESGDCVDEAYARAGIGCKARAGGCFETWYRRGILAEAWKCGGDQESRSEVDISMQLEAPCGVGRRRCSAPIAP